MIKNVKKPPGLTRWRFFEKAKRFTLLPVLQPLQLQGFCG